MMSSFEKEKFPVSKRKAALYFLFSVDSHKKPAIMEVHSMHMRISIMSRPLSGIKIVELVDFCGSPVTSRMLADLGSDVIKIEVPIGDGWRFTARTLVFPTATST